MNIQDIKSKTKNTEVHWSCRFHPTNWWHEVGCPHQTWTKKDLLGALVSKKQFEESKLKGTILTEDKKTAYEERDYAKAIAEGLEVLRRNNFKE